MPPSYTAMLLFLRRHPVGAIIRPAQQEERALIWLMNATDEIRYENGVFIKTKPTALSKVSHTFVMSEE